MSRRRYLVAYDIADPDRLRRVHSAVKGFGDTLRYSVFLCDLNPIEKIALRAALGDLINHIEDRIALVDLGDATTRGMACSSSWANDHVYPTPTGPPSSAPPERSGDPTNPGDRSHPGQSPILAP